MRVKRVIVINHLSDTVRVRVEAITKIFDNKVCHVCERTYGSEKGRTEEGVDLIIEVRKAEEGEE